jgi:hypothetical protein
MVGLLLLKQLEDLSDERVVLQFKRNPYYQYCCTDVLSTNDAVLTSINIPVVLMFCPLMTGMVILVSTVSLVDRTSVQQEW